MRWSKVFWEAVLVAVLGGVMAFAANALSPKGLSLSRDYFARPNPPAVSSNSAEGTNSAPLSGADKAMARLRQEGLQVVDGSGALKDFQDPGRLQGSLIFIDARNDQEYQSGHIPGAFQFDHFYPEKYLGSILGPCQSAQKIVLYCHGGDCELSEFAALFLRDSIHIPGEKLFVYAGGINEWKEAKRPMEIGDRNSGQMIEGNK